MSTANPILVEVVRGAEVESVHRGAACVVDAGGKVLRAWGDIAHPICPRSAIKPFQALPLIESGAAKAFKVSVEELALATASHSGEAMHTDLAAAWLARLGLSADDLECGCHAPTSAAAHEALVRAGKAPTALHHNCSGKHTGFLCLACHLGAPTKGYVDAGHAVQKAALGALARMADLNADKLETVVDGCSAVNVYMPLENLALACARLGQDDGAGATIIDAMKAHPLLMSGAGRPDAALITALKGRAIVKTGAEGVFMAVLPEQGVGAAVKIDDGAARAAVIAVTVILDHLGAFKAGTEAAVQELKAPIHRAAAGAVTGIMRAAFV